MASFDTLVANALANDDVPGGAFVATNRDGTFKYAKSFGKTSVTEGSAKPFQLDTVMWVASCTKLMTSICCMQLVERGLVKLDDPVYAQIPELKDLTILTGFGDDGLPIEEKHVKPITLRLLLTHTSGLSYDFMHPLLLAWLKHKNRKPSVGKTVLSRFNTPLVFQPGESWMYGPSIDYAGLLVERVTGQTLEEYMKANLWEPLGIKDMTFFLSSRPDMKARFADMSLREENGKFKTGTGALPHDDGEGGEVTDCLGGHGVFTTAEEYIKILKAVLVADEDEKILKKESLEEFFKPQLGEGSRGMMNMILQDPVVNNAMGGTSQSVTKDWGLGGILITADAPDGKTKGTMFWAGLPNLTWWVDRKTGLCGIFASQVLPHGDVRIAALNRALEAGIYETYKQKTVNAQL